MVEFKELNTSLLCRPVHTTKTKTCLARNCVHDTSYSKQNRNITNLDRKLTSLTYITAFALFG